MLLRWLISTIGVAALKGEISTIVKRAGRRALLAAIALLLWLTAFGFALATFVAWLSMELGTIAACGIVAAVLAVVGLVIQVALAVGGNRRRKKPRPPLANFAASLEDGLGTDTGGLGAIVIVALAGYLLGRRIFRR